MAIEDIEVKNRWIDSKNYVQKIEVDPNGKLNSFLKFYFPGIQLYTRNYCGFGYRLYYLNTSPCICLVAGGRNLTKTLSLEKLGLTEDELLKEVEKEKEVESVFKIFKIIREKFNEYEENYCTKKGIERWQYWDYR